MLEVFMGVRVLEDWNFWVSVFDGFVYRRHGCKKLYVFFFFQIACF